MPDFERTSVAKALKIVRSAQRLVSGDAPIYDSLRAIIESARGLNAQQVEAVYANLADVFGDEGIGHVTTDPSIDLSFDEDD